jgi:AraC-like DNA-binding protein
MLDPALPRSSGSAKLLLDFAARHGIRAAECLRGTRLMANELQDPLVEIAAHQEVRIVENLVQALPQSELGLRVGSIYPIRLFGIYGFAMLSAPTMRDVVEMAVRYQDLAFTLARASIVREPPLTFIQLDVGHLPRTIRSFAVDHVVATVIHTWVEMDGDAPTPRVELPAPRSRIAKAYAETLGVTPSFTAHRSRIGFLDSELDKPRSGVDARAFAHCEQECRALILLRKRRVGLAGIVRSGLERATSPQLSMEDIAAQLHLSTRSLRRALTVEGTSFREIAREARRDRARHMLTTGCSVAETADRLGYHDAAAFVNAYKRWHGVAPGRHMRQPDISAATGTTK